MSFNMYNYSSPNFASTFSIRCLSLFLASCSFLTPLSSSPSHLLPSSSLLLSASSIPLLRFGLSLRQCTKPVLQEKDR